jgi:hypothetical protein
VNAVGPGIGRAARCGKDHQKNGGRCLAFHFFLEFQQIFRGGVEFKGTQFDRYRDLGY